MHELAGSDKDRIKGSGVHQRASELPPDLFAVYEQRWVNGLSDDATAELLKIPVEVAKERMRSALRQLVNFARQ